MRRRKLHLLALVLLITTASVVVAACGTSGSEKMSDGPHMLYFNAKW